MLGLIARPQVWRPAASLVRMPLVATSTSRLFSTSRRCLSSDQPTSTAGKQLIDISEHPIIKRLPKFLHPYTLRFLNAPVSHVTSFIVLHELTAIAPLFGLWALFSHFDYVPGFVPDLMIEKGTEFIKVMGERNGWNELDGDAGARMVVQGAAAYGVVKILMPIRALISLALMPWFARWFVLPITRIFSRGKSSKRSSSSSSAQTSEVQLKSSEERQPAPADPNGQMWNQDLPAQPPTFKPKKTDPNRPSL